MSGKRDSNSRPSPWQGDALPTELLPRVHRSFSEGGLPFLLKGSANLMGAFEIPNQSLSVKCRIPFSCSNFFLLKSEEAPFGMESEIKPLPFSALA